MFKRLIWLAIGTGLGFGLSFWLARIVRTTVERYTPERVSADLTAAVRRLGAEVRAATNEGRDAMRAREAELRESLGSRR